MSVGEVHPLKGSQQMVKLRSQYRNTEKIHAFMHFYRRFCNELKKTTGNPDYQLRTTSYSFPGWNPSTIPGEGAAAPCCLAPVPQPQDLVGETIKAMKCILPTSICNAGESPFTPSETQSPWQAICNTNWCMATKTASDEANHKAIKNQAIVMGVYKVFAWLVEPNI